MLEDSPTGLLAGEGAGCVVVAVPSVVAIELTPGRYVVGSLAGIDVDWLLGRPEGRAAEQAS